MLALRGYATNKLLVIHREDSIGTSAEDVFSDKVIFTERYGFAK